MTVSVFLEKHFYVVNFTVLGLGALLVGLTTTNLIERELIGADDGKPRSARPVVAPAKKPAAPELRKSPTEVADRNMFCSSCKPAPPPSADTKEPEKPSASMDDAELLATLVAEDDDQWSMAAIRWKSTQETRFVAKGTQISDVEITQVEASRVHFTKGGAAGVLELIPNGKSAVAPKPPTPRPNPPPGAPGGDKWQNTITQGIRQLGPNKYEIDRSVVNEFISNAAVAGRDAAIFPHSGKDGKQDGFRLGRVMPSGIFARLGLRTGDVIGSINNTALSSPDKILELYTQLPSAAHMTIGITRYGKPQTIDYSIK
jgi:general secretion pathway protein C